MTTSVQVTAHCGSEKEVKITISHATQETVDPEVITLQDGESFDQSVYDDRAISVTEVLKSGD